MMQDGQRQAIGAVTPGRSRRAPVHRWVALWMGAFICGLLMWLPATAVAGDVDADEFDEPAPAQWTLSLGAGVQDVASRDELGSPLLYQGLGYPLMLRADRRAEGWSAGARLQGFVFGVNGGVLTTDQATDETSGHRADSVFADLSAWLQWPLVRVDDHRLSVGVQLSHWTFFRSYLYDSRQLGSVETWDASLTAAIRAQIERRFERWRWTVAASMAVAGRMMRPSYSVRGDDRIALINQTHKVLTYGRWATIAGLQKVQLDAGIDWQLTPRWGVLAQYRVGVMAYSDDMSTRAFSQQAMVGAQFQFR